jgi:hypothetical protein
MLRIALGRSVLRVNPKKNRLSSKFFLEKARPLLIINRKRLQRWRGPASFGQRHGPRFEVFSLEIGVRKVRPGRMPVWRQGSRTTV